jgi:hypothetical protein
MQQSIDRLARANSPRFGPPNDQRLHLPPNQSFRKLP